MSMIGPVQSRCHEGTERGAVWVGSSPSHSPLGERSGEWAVPHPQQIFKTLNIKCNILTQCCLSLSHHHHHHHQD